jgi:arylsulfatase
MSDPMITARRVGSTLGPTGFILAAVLPALLLATSAPAHAKPNVIVILTDDQGYGDLACHGNPEVKTPNVDRLYRESLRLTDFHVAPMCTPTRGQLMSGRDALANGAMNVSSGRTMLRRGLPTMANVFAASGYKTGQFGKWHLGDVYPYRPQDRGFQEALFFPSSHIGSAADFWDNDYFNDVYEHNGVRRPFEGYCTDVFFGAALQWIKACHAQGQPFFAYIATNAPHGPLFVPERYRTPYRHLPRNVASFFGMIANIDENVGKLEAMLEELGLRDDTIVVFLTDNGGTAGVSVYNAGMKGQKIGLYDGGHRVPCFLRWPAGGLRRPGDLGELTTCQDLLPTLIELCGLTPPAEARFDGISLAKLLRGAVDRLPERMVVVQFSRMEAPQPTRGDAAVLWDRWRLVKDEELYDLRTDPGQKTDVAAQHPEVIKRMRAHYAAWWAQVAPGVNEFSPIHVGSEAEDPILLSACDWQDSFLDQSRQVRQGLARNGAWGIVVERAGAYEITLRRWPVEADLPIRTGAPEHQGEDGSYPAGVALPIARARLRVGQKEEAQMMGQEDKAVTFGLRLEAGSTRLQTWFDDDAGRELCGAYYVSVHRVESRP